MYPTREDPSFGIFIKYQVEKMVRTNQVDITLIANCNNKKGKIIGVVKYALLYCRFIIAVIRRTYDIIHVHYIFPTAMLAVLPKIIIGTKLIISAHGSDVHTFPRKNRVALMLTRQLLNLSDCIVANSEAMKLQIEELKVCSNKIWVIRPQDIDDKLFKVRNRDEMREELGIDKIKHIIIYVGRITEDKGLRYLIEAVYLLVSKCNDISLYLIGDGQEKESLALLSYKLGIDRIVHFMGNKKHDEIPLWLSAADLFVLPTLQEGFGIAALEAMSCGLPVIASNVGGVPELVKNGINGYIVEPAKSREIAEKIYRVLKCPMLRKSLSEGALKTAEEYLSVDNDKMLLECYKSVILN
jgi:glycosyltransferase involved in cell wall biosynthesis